jgi:hypothetical protein
MRHATKISPARAAQHVLLDGSSAQEQPAAVVDVRPPWAVGDWLLEGCRAGARTKSNRPRGGE